MYENEAKRALCPARRRQGSQLADRRKSSVGGGRRSSSKASPSRSRASPAPLVCSRSSVATSAVGSRKGVKGVRLRGAQAGRGSGAACHKQRAVASLDGSSAAGADPRKVASVPAACPPPPQTLQQADGTPGARSPGLLVRLLGELAAVAGAGNQELVAVVGAAGFFGAGHVEAAAAARHAAAQRGAAPPAVRALHQAAALDGRQHVAQGAPVGFEHLAAMGGCVGVEGRPTVLGSARRAVRTTGSDRRQNHRSAWATAQARWPPGVLPSMFPPRSSTRRRGGAQRAHQGWQPEGRGWGPAEGRG